MKSLDWLIKENGGCFPCKPAREWDLLKAKYRLYRFLTEIEDVIEQADERGITEEDFLPEIRKLVRQLILNSYWVKTRLPEPTQETGTGVLMLYDELGFPMTVQTEIYLPGTRSSIHNHGTWGAVALLQGQQKNTFWKRSPNPQFPDKIEQVGTPTFQPGEIISFTSEAIHGIEVVGDEPVVTFNLYGETHANKRFKFDPVNHTAQHF